jgi:HD-like signal output (HDOD) protein
MLPLPTIAARIATTSAVSFPRTLEKLDIICSSEQTSVGVIAAVAGSDPLLTALLLGQPGLDGTNVVLENAIMQLGAGAIRGIVRRAQPIPADRRAGIAACWSLGNATATMAPIVAEGVSRFLRAPIDPALLHVAAQLHDLGTALALLHFPHEHRRAAERCDNGEGSYPEMLRAELGATPSDLSLILARAWHLPASLTMTMRWYDQPTATADDGGPFNDLVAIVHLSRALVRSIGFIADGDIYIAPIDETVLNRWSLTVSHLEGWLNQFYNDLELLEMYESSLVGGG